MRKAVLLLLALFVTACTSVPPGYVGVVVNQYGTERGVSAYPIRTGRVMYNPWTEDVYRFPTYQQNVVWTAGKDEGSPTDESITINSIEGAVVNFDVALSVAFEADSVPKIFVRFRQDDDHIVRVYVRALVRDAFSRTASRMPVVDLFGKGKQTLIDSATAIVRQTLDPLGIHVVQVSLIGRMRVDPKVDASINAVLTAAQKAIEAQNKIVEATAIAEQLVRTARGDSSAVVTRAQGQAQANRLLQASLTGALLDQQAIAKWNGVLPTVTSGNVPFISLPKP